MLKSPQTRPPAAEPSAKSSQQHCCKQIEQLFVFVGIHFIVLSWRRKLLKPFVCFTNHGQSRFWQFNGLILYPNVIRKFFQLNYFRIKFKQVNEINSTGDMWMTSKHQSLTRSWTEFCESISLNYTQETRLHWRGPTSSNPFAIHWDQSRKLCTPWESSQDDHLFFKEFS